MINVRELIYDPDFCQKIKVIRTKAIVDNHREFYDQESFSVTGVITVDERETNMQPSADFVSGRIKVFTEKPLNVTSLSKDGTRYIGDIVVFEGNNYKVESVLPDTQYGFSRAVCVLIERNFGYV